MNTTSLLRLLLFLCGFSVVLIFTGCGSVETETESTPTQVVAQVTQTATAVLPTQTPTQLPTQTSQPTETPEPISPTAVPPTQTPLPTATPSIDYQTSYRFAVQVDYRERLLQVAQEVYYVNKTDTPLDTILFLVEPNHDQDNLAVIGIRQAEPIQELTYSLEDNLLNIALAEPLDPGRPINLTLIYTLNVPEQVDPFGFNGRQLNLSDWYPSIPPRQNGEWITAEPSSVGEHLTYDIADFTLDLTLVGEITDLTVASSGTRQTDSGKQQQYRLQNGRSFALSLSPELKVATEQTGDITVQSYYFGEDEQAGRAVLDTAVAAIEIYQDLFGPYPHQSFSVISANLIDGREFSGFVFMDQDLYRGYTGRATNYLVSITAHEVAHQWWFEVVGNNPATEPWLDESLATYSELLFYERAHPAAVSWWWQVRVERFSSDRPINSTVYDRFDFDSYISTVYLRGAQFMHELRTEIGDDAFIQILKIYRQQFDGQLSNTAGFFDLATRYTERDLTDLRLKYFAPE